MRTKTNLACLLGIFLSGAFCLGAPQKPRTLLAIFAHPDDEAVVGPVLARYAREGVKVYLAIAAKGEKGVFPHAGIPAGDQLAAVRHAEAECACQQLDINPPMFFGLNDGEIGAITRPPGRNVQAVSDNFEKLLGTLNPDIILTFGPDGGYGHPDHRLVSAAVTQVIQSRRIAARLFYVGFSTEDVKLLDDLQPGLDWHATDSRYLLVQIPVTKSDQQAALHSIRCHKSQFPPEAMQKLDKMIAARQVVSFRPWFGSQESDDLFK